MLDMPENDIYMYTYLRGLNIMHKNKKNKGTTMNNYDYEVRI